MVKKGNRSVAASMRAEWDSMARENAIYYITPSREWDLEDFFRSGEDLVRSILFKIGYTPTSDQTALDIGCGLGRIVRPLAQRFGKVIGIDISAEMVERAKELHPDYSHVQFILGNGVDLQPIADSSVDFCFSYIVLQHIPDPEIVRGYIREMQRVLRPGGIAFFQLPTNQPRLWEKTRDRIKASIGATMERLRLRRFYRSEPRHPCSWIYPIPLGQVEAMIHAADLTIEETYSPHTPYTGFLCRKEPSPG